jgi:folate-dependent phosphoribosylglycinamide formyltransferase PurN
MKVIVITGSHPRNLGILQKLYQNNKIEIGGFIIFEREEIIPKPDNNLDEKIKKLWDIHFKKRHESEKKYYDFDLDFIEKLKNKIIINDKKDFNGLKALNFIKSINADACFIHGCPIIEDPILSTLPSYSINLHLGLIPYYKGSITAFWPFYYLEPGMLGTTYHIIDKHVDTGEIIHQNVPTLDYGDTMHDASCKALLSALSDIDLVVDEIINRKKNNIQINKDFTLKNRGKLFKKSDWKPEMLIKIYSEYDDKIVDLYLNGKIKSETPNLIKIN